MIILYNIVHYYHFSGDDGSLLRSTITVLNAIAIVFALLSIGCRRVLNSCYSAELGIASLEAGHNAVSDCIFFDRRKLTKGYLSQHTVHSPYHLFCYR